MTYLVPKVEVSAPQREIGGIAEGFSNAFAIV